LLPTIMAERSPPIHPPCPYGRRQMRPAALAAFNLSLKQIWRMLTTEQSTISSRGRIASAHGSLATLQFPKTICSSNWIQKVTIPAKTRSCWRT